MSTVMDKPKLKGLDLSEVMALKSKGRARNQYGPRLLEFCESDECAINPRETWPAEFAEKNASTLYQGFNNAAKAAGLINEDDPTQNMITIRQTGGDVFILHNERVELALSAANEDEAEIEADDTDLDPE